MSLTASLVNNLRPAQVVTLRASGREYALPLETRKWTVGAAEHCDLVIAADPYVSQVHCVLERRRDGVLVVRDEGSRNGTQIDGNHVEIAELRIGSYLRVGRTTLVAVAGPGHGPRRAIEILRGTDAQFRAMVDVALRAAATECNVLVVGETGTGKEIIARLVHEASRRQAARLVSVNCGAIPRDLIAAELFGRERGAYTGASEARDGYFIEADGGTLFLDEIGELPVDVQPNLLRALETQQIRRVGSSHERAVNVRIIAATNRLEGLGTDASLLRIDLYHRLATVTVQLPPLRERKGDIPDLVAAVLEELAPTQGERRVADPAWAALMAHDWPGNVRELRHAVSRAVTLGGPVLQARDFFQPTGAAAPQATRAAEGPAKRLEPFEDVLRSMAQHALDKHQSIRAAANELGMPKSTLADKARQWGLRIPKKKGRAR